MNENWVTTANRFVAFFDIMGFKDLVERNSHSKVLAKLELLKNAVTEAENANDELKQEFDLSETKSITFSDSIIIFSKSDTTRDANKIILDSSWLIHFALNIGIGIKGAISYGQVTVDFEKSLFFGRPIIDAYLLHDQLCLYTAILDHNCETKINSLILPQRFQNLLKQYKTNIRSGKVYHTVISVLKNEIEKEIEATKKLYESVSGNPRIYVDNTLDFLNYLLREDLNTSKP